MGVKSLFGIIGKDLKIFYRSKLSAAVIILMPFLIILLAGYMFNSTGLSGVVVGTYSPSDSALVTEIVQGFESQNFAVNNFDSAEDCKDAVKLSRIQICVIFPDDLSEEGSSKDILFYVDHSRLNIAYLLIQNVEKKVSSTSSELGVALTQNLIDSLGEVRNSLPDQRQNVLDSVSEVENVSSTLNSVLLNSKIDDTLEYLEYAKSTSTEEEVISDIFSAITSLETLRAMDIDGIVSSAKTQNNEISTSLQSISSDLNSLIVSLNEMNILDANRIVSPITTKVESVNVDSNNRDYLLPTLLALLALFGGILLSSTLVLKERKTKAYFRNFMTPASDATFILASAITCLIILTFQFILVFLGLMFLLKLSFAGMLFDLILVMLSSLIVFVFIGMFIGYVFRSDETIIFAAVLVASILMFFSNTILPIETISGNFSSFALFNPVVVLDMALKKILLFGFHYNVLKQEFYVLGGFFVVFVVLTYISRKITKRML